MSRRTRPSPWWRRVWPTLDQPFRVGLLAGLGMGVLFWALSASEVASTSGAPTEQTTVVAVEEHHSILGCGRGGGPELDITYRSENPPAGLPATFTDVGSCHGSFTVGERVEVVRVQHDDGHVDIYPNPIRSFRAATLDGVAGAVIGFVTFSGMLLIRLLALRVWTAWRGGRGSGIDS